MDRALYEAHAALESEHWWFVGRRRIIEAVLDQWVPSRDGARALDVGCGTGGMLTLLADRAETVGLEPDAFAFDCAARHAEAAVVRGAVPDDVPRDASFDLVTAFDVLEHLVDDAAAVDAMVAAARPGGHIVVTVPAMQWLWSDHDVVNHHHRRYNRAELVDVLEASGLRVEHASYFNTVLFPLAVMARLAGRFVRRDRPARSDLELELPSRTVNRILTTVFGAERGWIATRRSPFGLSLVAVASKPA